MRIEWFFINHLNKLEYPSPKDALWQVWLKLVQWFLRRFLNFVNVFLLFRNYLTLEKGGVLHFNKLESPSPKDALCQVWLKLAQWFLRRRFLNFVNVFLLLSHLGKRWSPSFVQTWIPFTQGCFVPSLVGSWEEDENVKVYDNHNDANDDNDDGQRTNFDHKSSLEPSAQVS